MTSHSYTVATSGPSHLVKRVDHGGMKPKSGFLSLSEELQHHILTFLPARDILRCASVSKALRRTYKSSSELQYIVELSGQRLLRVHNPDDRTPAYERLQLLRDKAHEWLKFDIDSFETFTLPEKVPYYGASVAYGHLSMWQHFRANFATIVPILPKPSQQTIEREWSPGTLCSVPDRSVQDVFMDPTQNLIAIAYSVPRDINDALYIDFRALDSGGVHPKAAIQRVSVSGLREYDEDLIERKTVRLMGFGSHIALWHSLAVTERRTSNENIWELHISDWQHSTKPRSVLCGRLQHQYCPPPDLCFLGNNRLLMLTADNLMLYSIQDMSRPAQLLACFLMPAVLRSPRVLSMDNIAHISQLDIEAQQTTYTSDPTHQVLCFITAEDLFCIISARIFFDLDGMETTAPIPWKCWGPTNTRIFPHLDNCRIHISGNRILWAFLDHTSGTDEKHILHMMDFSPLAVTNRRGLGRVVKEPSTMDFAESTGEVLTTSLPYVEVVSDRRLSKLCGMWIDKDRIYLLKTVRVENIFKCTILEVVNP
ncbi:hypothetical protein DFH29DRAFT_57448 [Suillus ampliporus]|nr:hypothetical protein DFH29DRAFT_57448 [Suillus ampliporus]